MRYADADNFQIRTYTRTDISILEIISEYTIYLRPDRKTAICTVRLKKGKRDCNQIVLVKTYHSVQSTWHTEAVSYPIFDTLGCFSSCFSSRLTSRCADEFCELWLAVMDGRS